MNKYTGLAATTQTLSVAAVEEASRFAQQTVDVEHLFLALVLSDGDAGQALRGLGITLDVARNAVVDLHSGQLASLGIDAEIPQGKITAPRGSDGYEWSNRSLNVLNSVNPSKGVDYSAVILKDLMNEPSGLIGDLLNLLGTNPVEVTTRLDQLAVVEKDEPQAVKDSLVGSRKSFVPAEVGDVWELLIDPSRMADWDPVLGASSGWAVPMKRSPATPGSDTYRRLGQTESCFVSNQVPGVKRSNCSNGAIASGFPGASATRTCPTRTRGASQFC